MVDLFFDYIEFEKRYSKHTLVSYRNDLAQFTDYLNSTCQITDPSQANYPMIRSWLIVLLENELTAKTVSRKVACLRSFYKFLLKKGKITKDPTLKITVPKIRKSLPVFVEEESMVRLLDQLQFEEGFPGLRDRLIIELLYGTGVRLSELINIREPDINVFEKTIKVLGKGNKQRIIPVNKTLWEVLDIYREMRKGQMLKNNDYLIVTEKGEKAYPMFIYRVVKKYLGEVPSEKKSPHVLRHTFATHLLNKGADLNAIKDLLGHSSLAATQVYTHNSIEKLKAIFDQAHPKS